jgi:hypothetical protein
LNKLHEEYNKKGLTIIGVTDEPASKIEPFITQKGIQYVIALGGAGGYQTNGIPHAWLVAPDGSVAWEGHPASLKNEQIEEHLRSARLTPEFKLPKELKRAQGLLDKGQYGSGLKELETYLKSPKSDEVATAAKEAVEAVTKYGSEKFEAALKLEEKGYYADILAELKQVETGFKGHELSEKAKKKADELKKDKKVKTELDAAEALAKAKDLIKQKKYKPAGAILKDIIESKKFAETKTRERAQKELQAIRSFI